MFNRKIKKELKELAEEVEQTKKQQLLINRLNGRECLYDEGTNNLIIKYDNQIRVVSFPSKTFSKVTNFKYHWITSSETVFKRNQFHTYPVEVKTFFLEIIIYYKEYLHQEDKKANRVIYQVEENNTKIILSEDINPFEEKELVYKEVILEEEQESKNIE